MKYNTILFDLDGTVTNNEEGISACVQYALHSFGIVEKDRETLRRFIGPPLLDSFMEIYKMDEEMARKAVAKYRERYENVGLYENQVYEGIPDVLVQLRGQGRKIVLATSKPEPFSEKILKRFCLRPLFDAVIGATLDGTRDAKIDVMREAIRQLGIEDLSKVVMIGDRRFDMESAKTLGIDGIGVLYGFGSKEELEAAGAKYLAETPADIMKYI